MVLIIADEPVAREVYGELFALRGYDVVVAHGARDGLHLARDHRIGVVVLALASGAPRLRRRLIALRPLVPVHVTGLLPPPPEPTAPLAPHRLH
jgi:DNA-binding NtrC family response regulator